MSIYRPIVDAYLWAIVNNLPTADDILMLVMSITISYDLVGMFAIHIAYLIYV